MSLEVSTAAMRLTRAVNEAESAADHAAITTAKLYSEIINVNGSFRTHEAAKYAHPAILRAQKAMAELTSARAELSRVHSSLLDAHRVTMSPEDRDCPDWVTKPTATSADIAA